MPCTLLGGPRFLCAWAGHGYCATGVPSNSGPRVGAGSPDVWFKSAGVRIPPDDSANRVRISPDVWLKFGRVRTPGDSTARVRTPPDVWLKTAGVRSSPDDSASRVRPPDVVNAGTTFLRGGPALLRGGPALRATGILFDAFSRVGAGTGIWSQNAGAGICPGISAGRALIPGIWLKILRVLFVDVSAGRAGPGSSTARVLVSGIWSQYAGAGICLGISAGRALITDICAGTTGRILKILFDVLSRVGICATGRIL